MDEETRQMLCRLITGVVVADDHLDDREDAFVDRLLARFDLPLEDRGFLHPIMDGEEAAAALRSLSEAVLEQALDLLAQAAAVDGEYAEAERDYLHAVGRAIGVPDEEVDRRVERALGG